MAYILKRPMFRKGGLSRETGIMSGLDRRGYAQGSYAPRVGYQDGSWLDKLKGLYSSIGRGTGIRGPGFTMSPPYTGTTLPATIPQTSRFSEKGIYELGKRYAPKIWSAIKQIPKRAPLITTGLAGAYVTDPEDWEEEMGISRWEKIKRDLTPYFGTKKKLEQYEQWKKGKPGEEPTDKVLPPSATDLETTDDIESDLMRAYKERLPVIEEALAGRPSTKSQWLALAKFGAGLAAEPGGDLIGAIGRAAKIPLDDLAKLQGKMEDKKTQAKLLALQGALDVTKPGEIARKVNDVQKLLGLKGKEGKKAAFAIVDRWVSGDRASRAAEVKSYREVAKEKNVNEDGYIMSKEAIKEKHPNLVPKLGRTTKKLPKLEDLEDDATPGEYYLNDNGEFFRYDPNREPPLLKPGDDGFEGTWKKKK